MKHLEDKNPGDVLLAMVIAWVLIAIIYYTVVNIFLHLI
jgi:hypothetical protein